MTVAQQMDFFDHQERARRGTWRLVALFALAVGGTIVGAYLVVAGLLVFGGGEAGAATNPFLIALIVISVLVVVGGGTLFKLVQLSGGGKVIARHLGGVPIHPSTRDPVERRVMNVVEEMAIASGVPTPPVYVMRKESAINAFAAGYRPQDAVIGVTRGCIEQLTRDELQGVMAHEFSHILNGDMRLNIRLIGVLHGILLIGLIGGVLLRSSIYMPRDRDGKSLGALLLAIGLGLMVVGYVGTFFGNWIKAAVSRQREFLADASAVQFTRNPDGIADALRRIGGMSDRSRLKAPNAAEASHMFFSPALLSGLFATHPPLPKRIRRIIPNWDGSFLAPLKPASGHAKPRPGLRQSPAKPKTPAVQAGANPAMAGLVGLAAASAEATVATPSSAAVRSIGTVDDAHLEHARALIESIPQPVIDAAHGAFGARAVVLGLIADDEDDARALQMDWLERSGDQGLFREVTRLVPLVRDVPRAARIPLIDLCLPALAEMTETQHTAFSAVLDAFVRADRKIDVFEWSLSRMLSRHLDARFGQVKATPVQYYKLHRLGDQISVLLSILARVGHRDEGQARVAVERAAASVPDASVQLLPAERCSLDQLDAAIATLDGAAPPAKRLLVQAMVACVWSDGRVGVTEAELFRAIADGLGVPVPPILGS